MRMWIILFVILILSTLAGLAYLTSRVAKFDILIKLTHKNEIQTIQCCENAYERQPC